MSQDTSAQSVSPATSATPPTGQSLASLNGQVKWFNNHLNYGFITSISEGEYKGMDIFVHQTNIRASGFRTLQNGEYVEFNLIKNADGEKHPYYASSVSGINGGKLMCEISRPTGGNTNFSARDPSSSGSRGEGNSFRPSFSGGSGSGEGSSPDANGFRGGRSGGNGFRGGRGAGGGFRGGRGMRPFQTPRNATNQF